MTEVGRGVRESWRRPRAEAGWRSIRRSEDVFSSPCATAASFAPSTAQKSSPRSKGSRSEARARSGPIPTIRISCCWSPAGSSRAPTAGLPSPRSPTPSTAPHAGSVKLSVHDPRGSRVRTLVDGVLAAGRHRVAWDGMDDRGRRVASGRYLVRFEVGGNADVREIAIVK
ncbi:MAG: hypothetical protein CME06_17055 [Gemmatimonadetes bacterium]|nr:hypothetical protein [Gemmatimonadota bacterium]